MPHLRRAIARAEARLSKNQRAVFIHVPKCGGTSLNKALRWYYPLSRSGVDSVASFRATQLLFDFEDTLAGFNEVLRFREHLLLYHLSEGRPFVSGHCAFSPVAHRRFGDRYKFITVLRNPVNRFLSAYFFNWTKGGSSPWRISADLTSYIDSEYGQNDGCQFVKFVGGIREGSYRDDDAIERAKANLEKFAIIGILEDPNGLTNQIRRELGFNIRLARSRPSPVRRAEQEAMVNDVILERIRDVCGPDMQVYEHAKALVARRAASGSPVEPAGVR